MTFLLYPVGSTQVLGLRNLPLTEEETPGFGFSVKTYIISFHALGFKYPERGVSLSPFPGS
jgi:hypothetical protein